MADPEVVVRGRGDFRDLNRDVAAAEARFAKMGTTIKRGLATSALAGTAALVKFGVDSVRAGSAAQQSLGATETVFGKYADTVIARSKEAAEAVGLSANEYRELANTTGATLANAGTPLKQVTKLTAELTKRAADMAATYGGTTKEAIESVSSLLRGEADPIERYGVSIKQSDVNARLAAQGLDKLTGSARKQAEQQARLDLLMQQTSKTAGQFGRESDTIAGKGQRLGAKVEDLEAKFSDLLIPALSAAADWASDDVVPALEDLHGWLSDNSDEFADMASTVKDAVVPALQGTVDVVGTAVELFTDLPGPVKEFGVQAGIAALIVPRLTAAVSTASTVTGGWITNLRDAEKRTAALSSAARTAAGVGGMVALTQATDQGNESLSRLSTIAGTTALGFAVGGPWGAAVGAAGSSLAIIATEGWKSADAVGASASAADQSTAKWQTYAATLDQVTGSITRATEKEAAKRLADVGALDLARQLGIATADVVKASTGNEEALARVTARVTELTGVQSVYVDGQGKVHVQTTELMEQAGQLSSLLHLESGAIAESTDKIREQALATGDLKRELKGVTDRGTIVTRIEQQGWPEAQREVRQLLKGIELTPEQVKVVIEALGVGDAIRDVDRFANSVANDAPKKAKEGGKRTGKAIADGATEGLSTTALEKKLKLGVKGSADKAVGPARTGGASVGSNMGAGMYVGLGVWVAPIEAKARDMVRGALNAANAEAKVNSPSKETEYTGRMMGTGLAVGLDATTPVVGRAAGKLGKQAVRDLLNGVTGGLDGVEDSLDKITALVEKRVKGKNDEKREKRILKGLQAQFAQLRANGQAQDDLISGDYLKYLDQASALYQGMTAAGVKNLEEAKSHLEDLRRQADDYATSIGDAIRATGDITQLGKQEDGTVSLTSLLDQLETAANNADRFADLTEKFAKAGLSKTAIDQILSAGPAAALATAEAIDTGQQEALDKINELQGRLDATGTRLGNQMSDRYYSEGINIAQGLINGLNSQLTALEAAAVAMADVLATAVRNALQIKSPSRVFMGIGENVVAGLEIGIDDTVAARSGASLAASLVKGFDNPQLSADVLSTTAGSKIQVEVRLTAEQLSAAQRGKAILLDIDAARTTGARAKAVTS